MVSEPLAAAVPRWATRRRPAILPCGVDLERFAPDRPRPRPGAALGLGPDEPYLLFAADPARPEKRYDRALAVAGEVPLLALGNVAPEQVPLWINAANAVLVPSEREGFGLAALEALACDVPVLATPVGVAPGGAGRGGRDVVRALRRSMYGGPRWRPIWRPATRGWRGGRGPSRGPRTPWRRGCWRRGGGAG